MREQKLNYQPVLQKKNSQAALAGRRMLTATKPKKSLGTEDSNAQTHPSILIRVSQTRRRTCMIFDLANSNSVATMYVVKIMLKVLSVTVAVLGN